MRSRSFQSYLISAYLKIIDAKSKYSKKWYFDNPDVSEPPRSIKKSTKVSSFELQSRNVWEFKPIEGEIERTILFLHGGAFAKNFQSYHWRFISEMSNNLKAHIIAPDYPLLPNATHEHVGNFMMELYEVLKAKLHVENMTILGDSCGATIALNLVQALRQLHLPQPKQLILLSPWLDLSLANPKIDTDNQPDLVLDLMVLKDLGKLYADKLEVNNPTISPIYNDIRRIAPITVMIGENDIFLADCRKLKLLSESQPIVFNYREFRSMFHLWFYFNFPEGIEAKKMIFEFIKNEPAEVEIAMQESSFGW